MAGEADWGQEVKTWCGYGPRTGPCKNSTRGLTSLTRQGTSREQGLRLSSSSGASAKEACLPRIRADDRSPPSCSQTLCGRAQEGRAGRMNGFLGVEAWEWFQSREADCMGLNSLEDPERVRKRGVGSI